MNPVEKFCSEVRHSSLLRNSGWLWDAVRPAYDALSERFARDGLTRVINGTDTVKISPQLRSIAETYEPQTWGLLMAQVRAGDTFVDVGSFVGLYALAVAKRVGEQGKVIAFEPEPTNYSLLVQNVRLNALEARVRCENKAVAQRDGFAEFLQGKSIESRLILGESATSSGSTPVVQLDTVFPAGRVDLLKIDVEGFEQAVLEGSRRLLSDGARRPRAVFIEVHPFNWHLAGTTSASLLKVLSDCGYRASSLDGEPINAISEYGEIIAFPVVIDPARPGA